MFHVKHLRSVCRVCFTWNIPRKIMRVFHVEHFPMSLITENIQKKLAEIT